MPAARNLKTILLTGIVLVTMSVLPVATKTYADDPCKKITDLDDKAKCYEERIDKKEAEYESTTKQLSDIKNQKDSINQKITNLASQLNVTQAQLDEIKAEVEKVQAELAKINVNLEDRRTKLNDKITLRNKIIRNYSKRNILNDIEIFLTQSQTSQDMNGFQTATYAYAFNKAASQEMINLIKVLNSEIGSFEKDKKEAEDLKTDLDNDLARLVNIKTDLDNKKATAQGEFSDLDKKEDVVEDKLDDLEKEIEDLSSKQQSILKQKYGDSYGTVGDYASPGSSTPSPPFKPAFAAFSYGAYTHYNGMSQYGAKGRADDGKDYKSILKYYYKVDTTKKSDFPSKINVQGYGELNFQYYLYGIAEMPSDWPSEALKAQAIAARTYAYRSNKPICTTQSCQVFLKSKADNPPSKWKKAVDDTKNIILNNPTTSQYSSTTGGYINNVGWDTKGSWPGDAYEKRAGSPWFYKAWYTKSYNSSDNCGRPHPWLTEKEMADILNAWVVWRKGSSGDKDNITPVTTSCWGGNPYSVDKMADRAGELGEKYTSVSSVDVDISNGGYTSKVTFNTNRGSVSVDGQTFKTVFNLRAPGYLSIKSRLFDMDRKN